MDFLSPFDAPLFSEEYEFNQVLAVPSSFKQSIILMFKQKTSGQDVVVKCVTDEVEIDILYYVERMRKALEGSIGAQFIRTFSHCKMEDPFDTYKEQIAEFVRDQEEEFGKTIRLPKKKANVPYYRGILMESVPLTFEEAELGKKEAIMLGFELLYTLWIARKEFQFHHGDMHKNNVMFKYVEEERQKERKYVVGGKTFVVRWELVPVIIDFEKSIFGGEPGCETFSFTKEKLSDVRRITEIMDDAGLKREGAFANLYGKVRSDSFIDSRFTPQTIEQILTDPEGVFSSLVLRTNEESATKKMAFCIGCKIREAKHMCESCRVPVCSQACRLKVDACCHGQGSSNYKD